MKFFYHIYLHNRALITPVMFKLKSFYAQKGLHLRFGVECKCFCCFAPGRIRDTN